MLVQVLVFPLHKIRALSQKDKRFCFCRDRERVAMQRPQTKARVRKPIVKVLTNEALTRIAQGLSVQMKPVQSVSEKMRLEMLLDWKSRPSRSELISF